jgi:hypothetical protein
VATWATNTLEPGGLIYSIDSLAEEFSDWGPGDRTQTSLTMSDDGAALSQDCVRALE